MGLSMIFPLMLAERGASDTAQGAMAFFTQAVWHVARSSSWYMIMASHLAILKYCIAEKLGLFALVSVPFSLKLFWAPIVDAVQLG